jgi:4a-hydroxytetrahydrobiopterin dehydratase
MAGLTEKKCVPCEGGTKPFNNEKIEEYKNQISSDWKVVNNEMIKKVFPFEKFDQSMAFAEKIASVAEEEQHHPDMCIHYSSVDVELSTHAIGGLSENDFIMAAKIDNL